MHTALLFWLEQVEKEEKVNSTSLASVTMTVTVFNNKGGNQGTSSLIFTHVADVRRLRQRNGFYMLMLR